MFHTHGFSYLTEVARERFGFCGSVEDIIEAARGAGLSVKRRGTKFSLVVDDITRAFAGIT